MTKLTIRSNKIRDFSPFEMTNLTELDLKNNKLTDVTFVKELTNLKVKFVEKMKNRYNSALKELIYLTELRYRIIK